MSDDNEVIGILNWARANGFDEKRIREAIREVKRLEERSEELKKIEGIFSGGGA